MIVEENKHGSHIITENSTSPVTAKGQDAYRNEIIELYHVTYIIYTICGKHNIRSGGITASCDGINAIQKAMDSNTTYLCLSNHFDLISALYNKLIKYTLTCSWIHVKVNQY